MLYYETKLTLKHFFEMEEISVELVLKSAFSIF